MKLEEPGDEGKKPGTTREEGEEDEEEEEQAEEKTRREELMRGTGAIQGTKFGEQAKDEEGVWILHRCLGISHKSTKDR